MVQDGEAEQQTDSQAVHWCPGSSWEKLAQCSQITLLRPGIHTKTHCIYMTRSSGHHNNYTDALIKSRK